MRCIFCQNDSTKSKSREHIIPESLGNRGWFLPPGIVCDKCNNYISIKIERKLLEQPYFTSARFRQRIESKKGRYPIEKGVLLTPLSEIELHINREKKLEVIIKDEDAKNKMSSVKFGAFVTPAYDLPEKDDQIIARFLGKVGIEELARRFSEVENGLDELIDHHGLDLLRDFVRGRKSEIIWPYHMRRIYDENKRFFENNHDFQTLNELTLLYTDKGELYIVLCIFGVELCLNMGGPEIEGYENWLIEHNNKSPLDPEFCPINNRIDYD